MLGMDGTADDDAAAGVPAPLDELERSAVAEAMNQMMAAAAFATSALLGTEVEIAPPRVRVLVDDGSGPQPTGTNIRRELQRLVGDAAPGDLLFFHYSGHGARLPAETGQDDDTGYDECIVPCDMNLITGELYSCVLCLLLPLIVGRNNGEMGIEW